MQAYLPNKSEEEVRKVGDALLHLVMLGSNLADQKASLKGRVRSFFKLTIRHLCIRKRSEICCSYIALGLIIHLGYIGTSAPRKS